MGVAGEYWCDHGLRVRVEGPDGAYEIDVGKPFARVGSHPSAEVVLPEGETPARAFYLHATSAGIFCVDLIHEEPAQSHSRGWLRPGEPISLGPYRLSACAAGQAAGPDSGGLGDLEAHQSATGPRPELVLSCETGELGRRPLDRCLTIVGRRRPSRLRVSSHTISSVHAALYWDGRALWAIDLLSSNGTLLDGRAMEAARVKPGGHLKLGRVEITCLFEEVSDFEDDPTGSAIGTPATIRFPIEAREEDPSASELAALAEARAALEAEQAAWEEQRQRIEAELTEARTRLDQEQEAMAVLERELDRSRAAWSEERGRTETDLEARRAALAADEAHWQAERERWLKEASQSEGGPPPQALELNGQFERLESQRRSLESERSAVQDEREGLRGEREELVSARAALRAEREALDAARQALKAERDEAGRERQALKAERDELALQQQALRGAQESLHAGRQALDDGRENLVAERGALDADRKKLAEEQRFLAVERQRIAAEQETLLGQQMAAESQQQTMAAERQSLDAQREELAAGRQALRSDREKLSGESQALEAEHLKLAVGRKTLETHQQKLAGERKALRVERQTLAAERESLQADRQSLAAEQAGLVQTREALAAEQAQFRQDRERLDAEQAAWEGHRQQIKAQQEAARSEREQIAAERLAMGEDRQAAAAGQAALEAEAARLAAERAALETARTEMAAEQESLARKREALTEAEQASAAAQEETSTAQKALRADRERLAGEWQALRSEWDALGKEERALGEERGRMAGERESLHAERSSLHVEWESIRTAREALSAQRLAWQAERERVEKDGGAREGRLKQEAAELAAARAQAEAQRAAWDEEKRLAEADLARREADLAAQREEIESRTRCLAVPPKLQPASSAAIEAELPRPAPGPLQPRPWLPPAPRRRSAGPWIVAAALAGAAIAGGSTWMVTTPQYVAVSVLRVPASEQRPVPESGLGAAGRGQPLPSPTELILSAEVLSAALASPEVAGLTSVRAQAGPATWLASSLEVDAGTNLGFVRVGLRGKDPQDTAALLRAVVQAYCQRAETVRRDRVQRRLDELQMLQVQQETDLAQREAELSGLLQAAKDQPDGPAVPPGKTRLVQSQVEQLKKAVEATAGEVERVQREKDAPHAIAIMQDAEVRPDRDPLWRWLMVGGAAAAGAAATAACAAWILRRTRY